MRAWKYLRGFEFGKSFFHIHCHSYKKTVSYIIQHNLEGNNYFNRKTKNHESLFDRECVGGGGGSEEQRGLDCGKPCISQLEEMSQIRGVCLLEDGSRNRVVSIL